MFNIYGVITIIISFGITLILIPYWMERTRQHQLLGKDVHKLNVKLPEAGGITVVLGSLIGILFYIAITVFILRETHWLAYMLAAISSILIALIIGFADDVLGWRIGIKQRDKVLLSLLIPIPLMVVNSGQSMMTIPLLGTVEFGLLYPLLIIPIGIIGASNAFNMLAGYNGLEAGMGLITMLALAILSVLNGAVWVAVIAFCIAASLFAFLLYNWYPSKIFPGDTLTYPVGASIAVIAILADIERYALSIFILYFIEFILKARGGFVSDWTSDVSKSGVLSVRKKINTLPHLAIKVLRLIGIKTKEYNVVSLILFVQLFIALLTIFSYVYL